MTSKTENTIGHEGRHLDTKKTYFIVTVDTETFPVNGQAPPFDQHIYAPIGGEEYGVNRIIDICEHNNFKATFFVDICMHHQYGESDIRDLCQLLDSKGHDVQVHAHPNWIPRYNSTTLHSYPYAIQHQIISETKRLYNKWLDRPPLAFRAGSYGANMDTIRALDENGFHIDSSYLQWNYNCVLSRELSHRYSNRMFPLGNVLELPITTYHFLTGSYKKSSKIDINACSWSEIKCVLYDYIQNPGMIFVILFLHSFSFIKQGKNVRDISPNYRAVRKFERILRYLKDEARAELISLSDFFTKLKRSNHDLPKDDYVTSISPLMFIPRFLGRLLG